MVEFVIGLLVGSAVTAWPLFLGHLREIRRVKEYHNDLTKRCIEAADQAITELSKVVEDALVDRMIKSAFAAVDAIKPFMRR